MGRPLYFCPVVSSIFFFLWIFFPHLISAVADWMPTSTTHGVALVQIYDAGLKCAARGSLKIRTQKFAICAPLHKFVGLYLRN